MRQCVPLLAAWMALGGGVVAAHAQTGPGLATPANRPDQSPRVITEQQTGGLRIPHVRAQSAKVTPFILRDVTIQGSSLPRAELAAAWRPFVGQTLDAAGILQLTDALAAVYARHDIAIYTVTVQNQDFGQGVVQVKALEGHIEAVTLNGHVRRRDRELLKAYGDRLMAETPLHRSTLQRYVSLIRDIPGLESQMELSNGRAQDSVRLTLNLAPHPVQLALSVNNRGTAFLGRTQVQGDLYLNSILRQGDQAKLTVAAPTDPNLFQSYGAQYVVPIGENGLTVTANAGYLRTEPKDTGLIGHATAMGLQLSYPIQRSYNQDIFAIIGLDGVNDDNAFLGFTYANDRTRALRAALSFSHQFERQVIYVSGTYSQGLDELGAHTTDADLSRIDFHKFNSKGGANIALGQNGALRLAAAGQWTSDRLPATEQFALGGEEFGRAYEASIIAGDYGLAGSAELAYRPPQVPPVFRGSEGFAFVDAGEVWYRGRLGAPTATAHLASAGVGVRTRLTNRAIVQVEADRALQNPLPFRDERGWRGIITVKTLF